MLIVGTEWIVDAAGCRVEALRDVATLRAVFDRAVAELELLVAGEEVWHQFPEPGGVTGLVLLTESHLACHTYPEYGVATINLYCCRARPAWPWAERLGEMLGAQEVSVRVVERPALASPAVQPATLTIYPRTETTAHHATEPPDLATTTPDAPTATTPDAATPPPAANTRDAAATAKPEAAMMMEEALLQVLARGGRF